MLKTSKTVLSGGGNWAGKLITNTNHPDVGFSNRDGMCNNASNAGNPLWDGNLLDSGICEGQTSANQKAGTYDVWDISGPTKLAAPPFPSAPTGTYDMYTDISMNGWNLAWDVLITETAPDGTTRYLEQGMTWSLSGATTTTGIKFYYNPQAFALVKGTNADRASMGTNVNAWEYHTPPPVRLAGTNSVSTKYLDVAHANWKYSTQCPDFHVIHSQTSNFLGEHLWYCEKELGNQQMAAPPPLGGTVGVLAQWYDLPVTFKKDHSYLATISMQNIAMSGGTTVSKTAGIFGPGLVNLDAMTYLELIV